VRCKNFEPSLDLAAYEGLRLRLLGNGLRYKCIIRTDAGWDGVGYCRCACCVRVCVACVCELVRVWLCVCVLRVSNCTACTACWLLWQACRLFLQRP
jgi:hypothetical protein